MIQQPLHLRPTRSLLEVFPSYYYLSLILWLCLTISVQVCSANQDAPSTSEYALKAVYLYNLTHFAYCGRQQRDPRRQNPSLLALSAARLLAIPLKNCRPNCKRLTKKTSLLSITVPIGKGWTCGSRISSLSVPRKRRI